MAHRVSAPGLVLAPGARLALGVDGRNEVLRTMAATPAIVQVVVRRSDRWSDGWDCRVLTDSRTPVDIAARHAPDPIEAFRVAYREVLAA